MTIQGVSSALLGAVSHPIVSLGNLANKVKSFCTVSNLISYGLCYSTTTIALIGADQINYHVSDQRIFSAGGTLFLISSVKVISALMCVTMIIQGLLAQPQQLQAAHQQLQPQQASRGER